MPVNNFSLINHLLKFENPGDCYYLEILRRKKDGNIHCTGNNGDRIVRDYLVSYDGFLAEHESEIKWICENLNARAYIRLNRRNYKQISFQFVNDFLAKVSKNDEIRNPFRALYSACGIVNTEPRETQSWLFDVDDIKLDDTRLTSIENVLRTPGLNAKVKPENMIIARIPSKSGVHLIVHPFNMQSIFKCQGMKVQDIKIWNDMKVTVHKDNPTILYCEN